MKVEVSYTAMLLDKVHRMPKVFGPIVCQLVSEDEIEDALKVLFQQGMADLYRCRM